MSKTNEPASELFVKEIVEKTEGKLRQEIENSKEELGNEIKKGHNEVMKKLDEEQITLSYRVSEHTDQLENHEKRIKKIEETTLQPSA